MRAARTRCPPVALLRSHITFMFLFLFSVCVLLLQDLLQSCSRGGRRRVEDMCYERRRAEACVDESAHHALAGTREEPGTLTQGSPVFPGSVWESNPELQGGWCKTQPPGR